MRVKYAFYLVDLCLSQSTKETCRGNYIYNDPSNTICSDHLQQVDKVNMDHFDQLSKLLISI